MDIDVSSPWWWDLVPAAVGAILGAAAASIPAYLLARQASREALESDRIARQRIEKVYSYRILVKMQELANSVFNISRTIEESIASAEKKGYVDLMTWQKVRPLAGLPLGVKEFEPEELAVFVKGHRIDMVNRLPLAVVRHLSILEQLRLYERLRITYADKYTPVASNGLLGKIGVEKSQVVAAKLEAAAMEDLIVSIREAAAEDAGSVNKIVAELGPVLRELLDDPDFPLLETTEPPFGQAAQESDPVRS